MPTQRLSSSLSALDGVSRGALRASAKPISPLDAPSCAIRIVRWLQGKRSDALSRSEFSYWSALRQLLPFRVGWRLLESGRLLRSALRTDRSACLHQGHAGVKSALISLLQGCPERIMALRCMRSFLAMRPKASVLESAKCDQVVCSSISFKAAVTLSVKVDPTSGVLLNVTSPPIARASFLVMTRPRPVPS